MSRSLLLTEPVQLTIDHRSAAADVAKSTTCFTAIAVLGEPVRQRRNTAAIVVNDGSVLTLYAVDMSALSAR